MSVSDVMVTVVIVTWNDAHFLRETLTRLERQTLRPTMTIVVDNGSTDGSTELVEERFPWARVIRMGRNAGFAAANNAGVAAAEGCEYVALLNADAYPEPDWLAGLVAAARRRPDVGFFSSRMMRATAPDELDGAGDIYHPSGAAGRRFILRPLAEAPQALEPTETFSACAGAALYRREVFVSVGGFDEDYFMYYEDTDIAFRMRLAGWRGLYVPDSVVAHVGSATAGIESDLSLYHIHRNMVWTWVKDMPWPLWLAYLPAHIWWNLATTLSYVRRGRGAVLLRAKRDALLGLPRQLRKRRAIQRGRRVPAGELLALMSDDDGRTLVPRAIAARLRSP